MFCGCANEFGSGANTNTCPTCLGLPGGMPEVNAKANRVEHPAGARARLLHPSSSRFARKNYFYPDLAKDFQTSQYDEPIAFDGQVTVELPNGRELVVDIERAHMEEDAGKLTHVGGSTGRIQGADLSLVDFNRGGVPLVEIVSAHDRGRRRRRAGGGSPAYVALDAGSGEEQLGVSNARMEEGATCAATRTCRSAPPRPERRARHAHRDEERQLAAVGRAGGALRDPPSGRRAGRGRHHHAGDPALARGHRLDLAGPAEVRRRRLPLLPGARPRTRRAVARPGWRSCAPRCRSHPAADWRLQA